MQTEKRLIEGIPAIIWGEKSDKVYIHVHGKMSRKEYAREMAEIAEKKGYQTLSFDLPEHGERTDSACRCDIWNGMHDLKVIADYAFLTWKSVSLFACSLGAYFSLNAYAERVFAKCLFQSPIVDMAYLVEQMFLWFDVTREKLREEKEIATPVDALRWDYYEYIHSHPITTWNAPTAILYGGKDVMQSEAVMRQFAERFHCKLSISPDSEHPFMQAEDGKIVRRWLYENV